MIHCDRSLNGYVQQALFTIFPLPHSQTDLDQTVKRETNDLIFSSCDVKIVVAISIISLVQTYK